jgi:hypothetical protein
MAPLDVAVKRDLAKLLLLLILGIFTGYSDTEFRLYQGRF